jgi:hypothetical protein
LIEIALLVLEKKIFFKKFSVYFYPCYYLPLGKGVPLSFEQFRIPSPYG